MTDTEDTLEFAKSIKAELHAGLPAAEREKAAELMGAVATFVRRNVEDGRSMALEVEIVEGTITGAFVVGRAGKLKLISWSREP